MAKVVKRIAAGIATLTLAFGVIAGTELSAGADTTSPATPISVLPQSGVTTQLDSAAQAAQVSVDQRSTTTKKKKKKKNV